LYLSNKRAVHSVVSSNAKELVVGTEFDYMDVEEASLMCDACDARVSITQTVTWF
jgi:hypothetical protein